MARVSLLDRERLEPGEAALVRLTLQQPIGALAGDRIVLRDTGATCTIGGGVVLDPFPPRRGRRTAGRLAQLAALEASDAVEALRGLLAVAPGWTDQASVHAGAECAGGGPGGVDRLGAGGGGRWADPVAGCVRWRACGGPGGAGGASSGVSRTAGVAGRAAAAGADGAATGGGVSPGYWRRCCGRARSLRTVRGSGCRRTGFRCLRRTTGCGARLGR